MEGVTSIKVRMEAFTPEDVAGGTASPSAVKLAEAASLKDKGAAHFKEGEWKEAAKCYHHGLMYTKGVLSFQLLDPMMGMLASNISSVQQVPPTEDEKKDAKALNIILLNNIAVCMLKLKKWNNVIKHCSEVLIHDQTNTKALYRRGVAYMETGQLDESESDLKSALQLDPTDVGIKKQLAELQERLKVYWKNEQQKYQGLFEK